MNKAEFIAHILEWTKKDDIPLSDIHVSHGGSLLMLGLKEETNDIDVTVPYYLYKDYLKELGEGKQKRLMFNRFLLPVTRLIDIHVKEDDNAWDNLLIDENGIQYRGVERTIYDYEQLKRPKDEEKIKLLKNRLKEISAQIKEAPRGFFIFFYFKVDAQLRKESVY